MRRGLAVMLLALALAACAPDQGPRPVRHSPLLIENVSGGAGWVDSTQVFVTYRLGACDEFERMDATWVGDTLHVSVTGQPSERCAGERVEVASTWVPAIRLINVIAHQPDGTLRAYVLIRPPDRPCPGPSFGIIPWTPTIVAGTETVLRIYACTLAFPRPLQLTWQVTDTTVATVTPASDSTAVLRARSPGTTTLVLREARFAEAMMWVQVVAPPK